MEMKLKSEMGRREGESKEINALSEEKKENLRRSMYCLAHERV